MIKFLKCQNVVEHFISLNILKIVTNLNVDLKNVDNI